MKGRTIEEYDYFEGKHLIVVSPSRPLAIKIDDMWYPCDSLGDDIQLLQEEPFLTMEDAVARSEMYYT